MIEEQINEIELSQRELESIGHSLAYAKWFNCGVPGHTQFNIIAKMAFTAGFDVAMVDGRIQLTIHGRTVHIFEPHWTGITQDEQTQ